MYMIRKAVFADLDGLIKLNENELGYQLSEVIVQKQLNKVIASESHLLLVAELDGNIVGYAHASEYDVLYFDSLYNLLGLSVQSDYQGRGIGRALMKAVEEAAVLKGKAGVRVNSGAQREAAHRFYQAIGYQKIKQQANFRKNLI